MPKTEPVTWIEVLNEQAEWKSPNDARAWLSTIGGRAIQPSNVALAHFLQLITFMRLEVGKVYFKGACDIDAINSRLRGLQPYLHSEKTGRLPRLRLIASPSSETTENDDDALLRGFEGALLVEFALWVGTSGEKITRCEGLFREDVPQHVIDDTERKFRAEIPLLSESELLEEAEIQRCGDMFLQKPKAKFCSDACRFSTFQIAKQIKDPKYLAQKQRRYRERLGDR